MTIDLNKLISPEAVARLRSSGLDKIAAQLVAKEGFKVGEALNMRGAVTVLGTKIRQKNAEYARVKEGLEALKKL